MEYIFTSILTPNTRQVKGFRTMELAEAYASGFLDGKNCSGYKFVEVDKTTTAIIGKTLSDKLNSLPEREIGRIELHIEQYTYWREF